VDHCRFRLYSPMSSFILPYVHRSTKEWFCHLFMVCSWSRCDSRRIFAKACPKMSQQKGFHGASHITLVTYRSPVTATSMSKELASLYRQRRSIDTKEDYSSTREQENTGALCIVCCCGGALWWCEEESLKLLFDMAAIPML
jgi:hypothetical protein